MRHFFWLILGTVLVTGLSNERRLFGQQFLELSPIQDRTSFGPVVVDEVNAYCYWPAWLVAESTVTGVELSTGRHLWSKPAKLAFPLIFHVEEGWLQYETTDGEHISARRTTGQRTFHLVNTTTGAEWSFPVRSELRSSVDRTWVHRGHCLTSQGSVVRCADGETIGDLGPGEHQTIIADGSLVAVTLIPDGSNTRFERRLLRQFNLTTMKVEREIELPLEISWRIVAMRGHIAVGRSEASDREPFLVCIDLDEQKPLWRVAIPRSVRVAPVEWKHDSELTLTMGIHGLIRPLKVDMQDGTLSPDITWQDPRLLLAWHQEAGQYPEFVATNETFTVGRWRYLQLSCIDSRTGQLVWNHGTSNYLIGRVFSSDLKLGDYIVAESKQGFDIVTVATGDCLGISPEHVGLERNPQVLSAEEENAATMDISNSLFGNTSRDWLWDRGLLLGPLIPIVGWMLWSAVRR